jgi:hypothetical protein
MNRSNFVKALVAVALSATAAQAQIAGTLNFSGTVRARAATLPGGGIDMVNVVLDFDPFAQPFGYVTVSSSGNTGSFAVFNTTPPNPPVFGSIKDITVGDGGAYNVQRFLEVPNAPVLYAFDLLSIAPGSFSSAACFIAPASGQTCTPDGNNGPTVFNLANTQNARGGLDATVSFNVAGIVRNPAGQSSPYSGTFTAQFPGMSYQQVLQQINTGVTVERSFSATLIATAVPEPSTYVLMGSGLIAIFGAGYARRRNNA